METAKYSESELSNDKIWQNQIKLLITAKIFFFVDKYVNYEK